MSNAIDLFDPEYMSLALPAGTVAVFVDGRLCDDIEPLEIVRGGWPEFGSARLSVILRNPSDARRVTSDDIEDHLGMGRQVILRRLFNATGPQPAIAGLPLFAGRIEGMETRIGPQGQTVELIVRDFSAALDRITVYGRYVGQAGTPVLFSGLDATFNPGGQPNAAVEPVMIHGRTCTMFCAGAAGAKAWTCAEAIEYLLAMYAPAGQLHRPDTEQLHGVTESRTVRDLDVTGLSLLDALRRCCEPAGLEFRFVPRLGETGPDQAIVFYRNGRGRCVELNCQRAGEPLSLSRTDIATLHSTRRFHPVTHRHTGQGDFKIYEATFELVKAWDPGLECTDYDTFCASANPQFHAVRDVYRKWCLNEAGDYSGPPYNRGEPFDFTRIFEGGRFLRCRRRFWPSLSADRQGRSLGYVLEVSWDNGDHWWSYPGAFNNLLDECGVWLSSDRLDIDTWAAALKGVLRFRITASVVGDERLTCTIAEGPVGSTVPVVDHVLTLARRFQYRKVTGQNVFAGGGDGLGAPDEVDDSAALYEFVRRHAATSAATIETIDVQTPTLALHFEPGDRVTAGPDGRDLLGCRRDNRSLAWIEHVRMDLRDQCTHLKIVRKRNM